LTDTGFLIRCLFVVLFISTTGLARSAPPAGMEPVPNLSPSDLIERPSMSTDIISFALAGVPYHAPPKTTDCCKPMQLPDHAEEAHLVAYRIPRNYIVRMGRWEARPPPTFLQLKVTFPGFRPLSADTEQCLTAAPAAVPAGCMPIKFSIRRGGAEHPPDEVGFANLRDLFHSQTPKAGPAGFELYEMGPDDARINVYRMKTSLHTLVISCINHRVAGPPAPCLSDSRLPNDNILTFHLNEDRLNDAAAIDTGLRRLIDQWTRREDKVGNSEVLPNDK
jgi:hypothetical protein